MKELLELLEHDARRPVNELASMLHRSEYEVEQDIKKLEKDKIILSYNTLINWEKFGTDTVTAVIEINLTPQREVGFDAIAERIYRFDEVRTVYLMSGSFDLLVIIEGKSLKDVANFVATRLATIEGVTPHYRIVVDNETGLDRMVVHVELKPEAFSDSFEEMDAFRRMIEEKLKSVMLVASKVKLVEPGGIERSIGKTKHVQDLRK